MYERWRTTCLAASALAALTTAGCSSVSNESTSADATPTTSTLSTPGVYGAPMESTGPDPTNVATDAPVTAIPDADGDMPIVLSFSGWNVNTTAIEVDGYLTGLVESDGLCTLTLTNGDTSVTTTTPGTPDAKTTSCGGAAVPGDQLSPGAWTAVLTYESSTSHGSSGQVEVQVP